jgi:hypothetical protein
MLRIQRIAHAKDPSTFVLPCELLRYFRVSLGDKKPIDPGQQLVFNSRLDEELWTLTQNSSLFLGHYFFDQPWKDIAANKGLTEAGTLSANLARSSSSASSRTRQVYSCNKRQLTYF